MWVGVVVLDDEWSSTLAVVKHLNRYYVKTDKASGIVSDPNDFLREQDRPNAVVDLIKRLVTVSMRTQELVTSLPKLEIPANA